MPFWFGLGALSFFCDLSLYVYEGPLYTYDVDTRGEKSTREVKIHC